MRTGVDLEASDVSTSETVERVVMTLVISGTGVEVFGDSELIVVSSLMVDKISDVVIDVETNGRVEPIVVISFPSVVHAVTRSVVVDLIDEIETVAEAVVVKSTKSGVVSDTNVDNVEK